MAQTITFSRNVFLPLTNVCANACGYCSFKAPVGDGCVMPESEVLATLKRGSEFGCTEALFTFGERPENEPGFRQYIERAGYPDILSYCMAMSRAAIDLGMLPHTNAGILTYEEMERLRNVNASMGLMLETTAEVPAHRHSPGKDPAVRIQMLADAGKLKIPFTTGLLLGIGETVADREESLMVIRDLQKQYGHIQEVIIQNFCPKPGTEMADTPGATADDIRETLMMAAEILPKSISIQIPPNLADASALLSCGVTDLGGVSPVTIDYINPEHPWPALDALRDIASGYELRERLCVYPQYCNAEWIAPELLPLVQRLANQTYGL
ncbi:7,8-didemethyl-8-hydroxy-5-deazariboflavin synthase subunit CofG [Methanorbis furvi]|uniref:7,8-didemethyl-8-hydroxy-5-deazariboflavin synthase n=1 Tax=Methanorbis furvi TaxID=3028299 RepID=A0AAE4S996_9EURY|nr:FO synthase [Methanocorpusculaceae archaeon Ag1]